MKKKQLLLFLLGIVMVWSYFSGTKDIIADKHQNVLRTAFSNDPVTLDPRKGGDIISSCAQFMLFEGLTRFSPVSGTDMGVAESVEKNFNSTEYIFHLRESCWSDGHPVTAYDFKAAWSAILTPGFHSVSSHLLYSIKNAKAAKLGKCTISDIGITVIDDRTLKVTLEYPNENFLEITSFCVLFPIPSHIVQDDHWGDLPKNLPVSNGPFKVTAWKRGDHLTFEKNPFYWDRDQLSLDGIFVSIIRDGMSAAHLFREKKLDFLAHILCPMPSEVLIDFKNQGLLQSPSIGGSLLCVFNTTRPPFSNLSLRKAFSLAIDRKKLVDHVTRLDEKVAYGMIPPVLKEGSELILVENDNLELAQHLFHEALKELHLSTKDFGVKLTYVKSSMEDLIAQAIQSFWMDAFHIHVELTPHDYQSTLHTIRNRDYEISLIPWAAQYSDPTALLERLTSFKYPTNYAGWENSRYKELIHTSSYIFDSNARRAILDKAELILAEQLPVTPIYHLSNHYVIQPWVNNIYMAKIGSFKFNWARINKTNKKHGELCVKLV